LGSNVNGLTETKTETYFTT